MGWTTLSVHDSTQDRFNALKQQATQDGEPPMSADTFINALLDTWEAVDDEHYQDNAREELIDEITEIMNGFDTEQQTLDGKREIMNRLDDLETEFKKLRERLEQ